MGKKKIGYWLKEGKAKRIEISKIEEILARKYDCDLVPMDGEQDNLPRVDAMFHKMSDLIFDARQGKRAAIDQLEKFMKYFKAHEGLPVFDPLPNIETLLDRVLMMEAVQKCSNTCPIDTKFYSCGYHLVESEDPISINKALVAKNFQFPVICKSRIAQGALGHDMSIIFSEGGLKQVKPSNVIVPFIDHDAVLYKVFVCGDKFHVVTRPSITLNKLLSNNSQINVYNFHSDNVSKVTSDSSRVQEDLCKTYDLSPLSEKHMALIPEWVKIMRSVLNLSLFGFDVILESASKKPVIIDINYFPGYDGFENFHEILSDMLYQAAIS
ncbi:inositol-tetrakisphosphate 1-kinase-like isoform X2 [Bolinopsis microptera]|uniref:inositol-tetrakisphosphate 1-kinase-like isoform X2 n=1 Tax=Bolinopsis microptera TaxID=2820187 RepID=UPI0030798BB1